MSRESNPTIVMLSKAQYPEFRGGQNRALTLTAFLWFGVLLALFLLRWTLRAQNPVDEWLLGPLVFVWIGWSQASLNNGFHEAVHDNFGERHRDWLALVLLGFPTGFTLQYRDVHLRHHQRVGDPEHDPDFATYANFPKSRMQFLARLLFMGSGLAAAQQLVRRNLRSSSAVLNKKRREPIPVSELAGLFATQALICAGFALWFAGSGGLLMYVLFWLLPLGMVAKLAKSTRAFCEHGSPSHTYVLRTITGRSWQTATLGMYGFHYHGEHHLYPWVPYAKLPALRKRLATELEEDPETREGRYEFFEGGYFALLASWFRELPWRAAEQASK